MDQTPPQSWKRRFFPHQQDASPVERVIAAAGRLYPLVNGCGTVSSSRLARWIIPFSSRQVWGRVGKRPCLVRLDDLVGRAIFLIGELDRKVGKTIERYVKSGDVVLDVGANLGLVSLQFANQGASRIVAFEPNPSLQMFLQKTFSANSDVPIELVCAAVGNTQTELNLSVPSGNAGGGSLVAASATKDTKYKVPVETLANLLDERGIAHVEFMKIDVEGYEALDLEGLFKGSVRPRYILFEDHSIGTSRTSSLLSENGYKLRGISSAANFKVVEVEPDDPRYTSCHDFIAEHPTG